MMEEGKVMSGEAKKVLSAIGRTMHEHSQPLRWSEIRKKCTELYGTFHDTQIKRGVDNLKEVGVLEARGQARGRKYGVKKQYETFALNQAIKQTDIVTINSQSIRNIIQCEGVSPSSFLYLKPGSVTVYGLPKDVFRKTEDDYRTLNKSQEETIDFDKGISTVELFGKFFGLPRIRSRTSPANMWRLREQELLRDLNEDEIIKRQVEHYMELIKDKKMRVEEVIQYIIKRHREERLTFKQTGQSIIGNLLGKKVRHRYDKLKESLHNLLRKKKLKQEVKSILRKYEYEFLEVLNYEHDLVYDAERRKQNLEEGIFVNFGKGWGPFNKASPLTKEEIRRREEFEKDMEEIKDDDKKTLLDVLIETIELNNELYPTSVAFFARNKTVLHEFPIPPTKEEKEKWKLS